MIYPFPDGTDLRLPEHFTNPFRYSPDPLVQSAAGLLMQSIKESDSLHEAFAEGKMLGILVVSDEDGRIGYLAGFSGNAGGRNMIDGFVPPIYDLLDPSGHFKAKEAEITHINETIRKLETSGESDSLKERLSRFQNERETEIQTLKARMAISKRKRDEIRSELNDTSDYGDLIRQSQHEKAELRRCRQKWDDIIGKLQDQVRDQEKEIARLKGMRSEMSDELQKWIFGRYIVHNRNGEEKSIARIFEEGGLVPPGGTGECAAPKLLEYAYRNRLRPVAMGEFWYGDSPSTAVRTEGHFYPSCTSKCGPLLKFMTEGLGLGNESEKEDISGRIVTIYEDDDIIAVEKPSGIPSVPGLDGKRSILEVLEDRDKEKEIHAVHRLDMDTSGIILFARNSRSAIKLRKQFESHEIRKTYLARLSPCPEGKALRAGDSGLIDLPLNADYDERPRQKADRNQGKESLTSYEVTSVNADGTLEVIFHPLTGRTHQLRVHSAHMLGLGHPIVGDMLYGGTPSHRLHLHAHSIAFRHPSTDEPTTLQSSCLNHFQP